MIYLGHTIITNFVYPPIPIRTCDWVAYTDNYDGADDAGAQLIGWGATLAEAIEALKARIDEEQP